MNQLIYVVRKGIIPKKLEHARFSLLLVPLLSLKKTRHRAGYYSFFSSLGTKKSSRLKTSISKYLGYIGFFCLCSLVAKAAVQVQVEPSQISLDESFRLILTQDDLKKSGVPDLRPLQKDFIILGTERQANYSIINGQTSSSSEWFISLKAQREGLLIIPSIKMGTEETPATSIKVTASSHSQNLDNYSQQKREIFLTTEVSKKNPYLHEEIIYKVRLYNSKQLLDAEYQGPQVQNALLIPLDKEKPYQTRKDNIDYVVEEQSYAIFPQKSGPLKISPPSFTALVYDFNPQRLQIKDKAINLEVRPIPKKYSEKAWLPAKKLKLIEQYAQTGLKINQGDTLIRTVTLEGVGIPAQFLPVLNFEARDGFSVYSEQVKHENQVHQGELIARTQIKVTYLFSKPGMVTIPELKVSWFNSENEQQEHATLASRTLEIKPSSTVDEAKPDHQTPGANPISRIQQPKEPRMAIRLIYLGAAVLACLLVLILCRGRLGNKGRGKSTYKKALKQLHQACVQGNPMLARNALLQWAMLHWPDVSIVNLNDLSRLVEDPLLDKQIQVLSQILYKNQEKNSWSGKELWCCIQKIKKITKKKKSEASALPPINPF